MRLTKIAQKKINQIPIRLKLALRLGKTERSIQEAIRQNKPDSMLTLASALEVIRQETGLSNKEILND